MTTPAAETIPLIPLARLLAGRRIECQPGQARVAFDVSDDWLQGRTAFGGLSAALGVQAMRDAASASDWPTEVGLRALQMSFVGPVGAGPVEVEARLLREGRTLRQAQATLHQHGRIVGVALGVFGADRGSALAPVGLQQGPARAAPGSLPRYGYRAGSDKQFLRHFDLRWDDGPMPGSGGSGNATRIHMRLVDGDGLDDELKTVLLADVSPTPVLGHFRQAAPGSSVTWALELRPSPDSEPADGWWRADNESVIVGGGTVNHAARLWAPGGRLAALGYQLVAVYG